MATPDDGTTDPSSGLDLDRLIGELETEAARRRAEPGYPHDADARLHFELARRAPDPPRAPALGALVDRVAELASAGLASAPAPTFEGARSRRRQRQAAAQHLARVDDRVTSVGLAIAAVLHAITDRLQQLEERAKHQEPRTDDRSVAPSEAGGSEALARWTDRLSEALPREERVLYAGTEADIVVARLRSVGVDVYGITDVGPRDRPGPDVRHGDLSDHLRAVDDGALGAVLLAGVPEVMTPHALGPLVAELRRVAKVAVIISEAQWWWRQRLGAVRADLALGRPLDPDTWLDAFHRVAMDGSAEYDATGQSYRVVARARE
jgi:hypothetical protein